MHIIFVVLCAIIEEARGHSTHNSNGHGLLVRLMKDAIYSRKKGFVDGRRYSSSVKSGNSGKTLTCPT